MLRYTRGKHVLVGKKKRQKTTTTKWIASFLHRQTFKISLHCLLRGALGWSVICENGSFFFFMAFVFEDL